MRHRTRPRARGTGAPTLVVLAKAPVPGLAKTRLTPPLDPEEAADLAAAALLDTLDTVTWAAGVLARTSRGPVRPVVALSGDLGDAARSDALHAALARTDVVGQRGSGLAARIVGAHLDAAALHPGHGTLQVGMDTPQARTADLVGAARRLRSRRTGAVLGLADDGGWWALGLRDPAHVSALLGVPMSRDDTGALTLAALTSAGTHPRLLPRLRDVDRWDDALAVAAGHPGTRFADAVRRLHHTALTPYDVALRTGGPCWVRGGDGAAVPLPVHRWLADADARDDVLLARCGGATLDMGCGPGRLTVALAARGMAALGVDVSAEAVRIARARGASALRRDVFDALPGERRWRHVLLADGNVGIGGDPAALLARAREVLAPGGSVVVDVERPGVGLHRGTWHLEGPDPRSRPVPFPWARLGVDAVAGVATTAGLALRDVRRSGSRWVAVLDAHDGASSP